MPCTLPPQLRLPPDAAGPVAGFLRSTLARQAGDGAVRGQPASMLLCHIVILRGSGPPALHPSPFSLSCTGKAVGPAVRALSRLLRNACLPGLSPADSTALLTSVAGAVGAASLAAAADARGDDAGAWDLLLETLDVMQQLLLQHLQHLAAAGGSEPTARPTAASTSSLAVLPASLVGRVLALLRPVLAYGLSNSDQQQPPVPPPREPATQKLTGYVPPHLRGGRGAPVETIRRPGGGGGSRDASDSDGEGAGWRGAAAAARARALSCVEALVRLDVKAALAHWAELLPQEAIGATNPRPPPTLAAALVLDPSARVRAAAAAALISLLDGPAARSHLAVAECRAAPTLRPPVRGFTTLSAALGLTVVHVHAALLACVKREPSAAVLAEGLRALRALLGAAPYGRLPPSLLADTLRTVRERLTALLATPLPAEGARRGWRAAAAAGGGSGPSDAEMTAAASAAGCLAAAASAMLASGPRSGPRGQAANGLASGRPPIVALADELRPDFAALAKELLAAIAGNPPPAFAFRLEALDALAALAAADPRALYGEWPAVATMLSQLFGGEEEKLALRGLGALAELLRAAGGGDVPLASAAEDDVERAVQPRQELHVQPLGSPEVADLWARASALVLRLLAQPLLRPPPVRAALLVRGKEGIALEMMICYVRLAAGPH